MQVKHRARHILYAALVTAWGATAHAAEAPYYNPANAASPSGYTTDYKLYKTIGCPGRGLLDAPCKEAAPTQAAAPAKAPASGDADKDGVADDKDRCPNTPAGAKVDANGCELDSDGDGVVDRLDKCPDTPAGRKVNAQGCELDSDGDGVVDALDQCPDTPAGDKVDNKGCTLANTIVLKGVNFDNDSAVLKAEAKAILDDSARTLKRYPDIKAEVAGHTDSRAADAYNQALSQRRAQAVMDYLISAGVPAASLSAKGYGEAEPVADNATEAGRADNRRVELRIR
ncbi:MAG: OmpA family protein [Gammaproteobacteria bacterium]